MAVNTLVSERIGAVSVDKGNYIPGSAYAERNQVHIYNSVLESKHSNNTTTPAELVGNEIVFNTTHWIVVVDGSSQWLIDQGIKKVEASHVKDGSKTQQAINAETSGRITELEQSVGVGGSVDERIEEAKADIIGDASSNYNTLEKVQDRLTEEAAYRRAAENNRYTKAETYTKEEVNGLITTPSQEYKTYEATDQTTDITDILPSTGEADTIYRVGSWDGTQYDAGYYSEYAWSTTSSAYVFLKKDNVGIDEEPTPGSSKSVTSGGAAAVNGFHDYNNHDIIEATLDANDKILSWRDKNNVLHEQNIDIEKGLNLQEDAHRDFSNKYSVFSNATILADEEGNDIPLTEDQKLTVEKAADMSSIKWTPITDIPGRSNSSYAAGEEKSGTPYSATYEKDKCVGMDVSLETFMTAVNNPFSLLYTERTDLANSASAWGITYHGVNDYAGTYYGNVCSDFVSYALNFRAKYHTGFFGGLNRDHKIGRIIPMRFQSAKIGDMLYQNGHIAMVSGVKRNDIGQVVKITVTEESLGSTHNTEYTDMTEFDARLINRTTPNFFRDICMAKDNHRYTFDAATYEYNDDICTFAGDKACFNEGELIVINYNLKNTNSGWTAIELYKNDVLFATYNIADIDQSELPEGQRNHALKLANGLEYGDYKARLTDGVNYSDYTTFKVVEANVTVENLTASVAKVSFSSSNGTPKYINIATQTMGVPRAIYELTEQDITNGYAILDAVVLSAQRTEEPLLSGTAYHAKVYFETPYGRVAGKDSVEFTF